MHDIMKHTKLTSNWIGIFGLIVASLFNGCAERSEPVSSPSELYGLASPYQLKPGENLLVLSDYFPGGIELKEWKADSNIRIELSENSDELLLYPGEELGSLSNLTLITERSSYDILLKAPSSTIVDFSLEDAGYSEVRLKGTFSNWASHEMSLEDGKWVLSILADNRRHAYVYLIDGVDQPDPENQERESNGSGGTNSILDLTPQLSELPLLWTVSSSKDEVVVGGKGCNELFAYWQNNRIAVQDEGGKYRISIPESAGAYRRSFIRVFGAGRQSSSNDLLIPLQDGRVVMHPQLLNRKDLHTGMIYNVFVDRFEDGDPTNNRPVEDDSILPQANFHGGDLKGISKRLRSGYFDSLGMTALWISPVSRNPEGAWGQFRDPDTKFSGYHGYWPVSNIEIDDRMGTEADLHEVIELAHKRGMNVYLDYVANHIHIEHPIYQKHPEWATDLYLPDGRLNTELWDEQRLTTWFDVFLPTLNLEDQQVAEYMVDSALYWLHNFDLDGFRHDATKHIPLNYQRLLTKKIKNEIAIPGDRTIFQLGETYGSHKLISSYVNSGMLDAQFNFNLYDKARPAFAYRQKMDVLADQLQESLNTYGSHHLMGSITGNQDKARFMTFADGIIPPSGQDNFYKRFGWKNDVQLGDSGSYRKLALFQAFNFAIPGTPIVYYGDDIGMVGAGDPDNRRMMRFEQLNTREQGLRETVARLAEIRRNRMSMLYGETTIEHKSDKVLVFVRSYFGESAVMGINLSDEPFSMKLPDISSDIDIEPNNFKLQIVNNGKKELEYSAD